MFEIRAFLYPICSMEGLKLLYLLLIRKKFFVLKWGLSNISFKFQYVNKEIVLVFANFTSRNLVLMITILTR